MLKRLLAAIIVASTVLCAAVSLSAVADDLDDIEQDLSDVKQNIKDHNQQLDDFKQRLEDIQKQRDDLQKQNSQQNAELQTWLSQKISIEQDAALLLAKRDTMQKMVEEYNSVIEQLQKSADASEKQLDSQLEDIATLLVQLYKNNNASDLELFFKAESYSSYVAHIECMEQLIGSCDEQVKEIYATMAEIEKTREEHDTAIRLLSAKKRELVGARIDLAYNEVVLDHLIENNKNLGQWTQEEIDKMEDNEKLLADEIEKLKEQLDALKSEEERLEDQKKKEELEQQQQQRPGAYDAALRWPLPSAYGYYISSRFGPRTGTYAGHHNGLDIVPYNGEGTPILSADEGTVIFAGNRGDFGNAVFIDHGNGLTTVYAHCHTVLVETGAKVLASQTIATVGNTGQSGGDHLHFAVVKDGSYVNPEKYLPTSYTD